MTSSERLAFWCQQVDQADHSWSDRFRGWQCSPGDETWDSTDEAVYMARTWATADDYVDRPDNEQLAIIACLSQSEQLADHDLAITLSQEVGEEELTAVLRERHEVIRQYRRFPARNRILGRASTPAEAYFMTTAGQQYS